MSLSPFVRDAAERATKTFSGGLCTYLFEGWLGFQHLPLEARAAMFGAGTAAFSWMLSLASRRVEMTVRGVRRVPKTRGTASLLPDVEYRDVA